MSLTLVVAGVLSALSFAYSLYVFRRCKALGRAAQIEADELEARIAERGLKLELGLGRRTVRGLARATLFGGTGLAVWELTGGSTHYPPAGVAFVLGFAGWAACGELERRVGSLADSRNRRKPTR